MSRRSSCPDAARVPRRAILVFVLWAAAGLPAIAQPPPPLLEAPRAGRLAAPVDRTVRSGEPRRRRSRRATMRVDRLRAALDDAPAADGRPAFLLNLFDDAEWPAVFERLETDGLGHRTWAGHVAGEPLSAISITVSDAALSGTVQVAGRLYRLDGAAADVRVEELDPASFGTELPPVAGDALAASVPASPGDAAAADGAPVADVLLLYTTEARLAQGGIAGIRAALAQGVADANTALARSGVPGRLRVAAIQEVAYPQSSISLADDLGALASAAAVATMRDAAGADLVALVVEQVTGGACGVAYVGPSAYYPFSVTARPCLAQYTLAHELAHGFGSDHAPGDSPPWGWRPYSYGYKDPTLPSPFRTVMAYRCPTVTCPRVLHFSSPTTVEAGTGRVTGTPMQDNAASLAEAFPIVAAFRAPTVWLSAPTGVRATGQPARATLEWQAVTGATGYVVESGTAPGGVDVFAGPVGDVLAVDATLAPGTYYARVRALRGAEAGPWSTEVSVIVTPPVPPAAPDALDVAVSGRFVTLSWDAPPGDASAGYQLEVGYAAGASDAAVAVVSGAPVVVPGVPPGVYYVRVRAIGLAGLGAATSDVRVVVP